MTWMYMGGMPRAFARHAVPALTALLCAGAAHAQAAGVVRGRVVGTAGQPLSGAVVEVPRTFLSTRTRADGAFEIRLPASADSLRARAAGHVAASIARPGDPGEPVLLRLAPIPVMLEGLTVEAAEAPAMAQSVSSMTVRHVPPLGEPDVFRAVVLLPGVSQPNDLKGRIHLGGGASDETGVRLDGHPLQDPFHLLGLFGAFNVAALERADVLINRLPPSLDGRLSGVINLETLRPGAERGGEAVLSLLTGGLTHREPVAGADLLVSARTTYLDRVATRLAPDAPRLGFREGLVRVGRSWGGEWRTEALAFTTRDVFRDPDLPEFRDVDPLTWGESMVGVRATRGGDRWETALRASFNRAHVDLDERGDDPELSPGTNFITSRRDWWSAAAELTRRGERTRGQVGLSADVRRNRQAWLAHGLIDEVFSPATPAEYEGDQEQSVLAAWAEASADLGAAWEATLGGRVTGTESPLFAPRVHLAFRPSGRTTLEASFDRRYQFDAQLEEPIEGSVTAPTFLLQEPRIADVAALAAEWRSGPGARRASAQAQVFWKDYRRRTLLPATSAPRDSTAEFPDFERISGYSTGAMLGARVGFAGDGLLQGSYSYQRVREHVGGGTYPTSWDAPHTLSLLASVPVRRWTLGAVYQAHSGRATTPVIARIFAPSEDDLNELDARYIRGERNSLRVPSYHRLDLGARRTWQARGAEWTLALQALNLLFRDNAIDYDWQQHFGSDGRRAGRSGLPLVPSLGLEVRW